MQPKYLFKDEVHSVTPKRRQQSVELEIDGKTVIARLQWQSQNSALLTVNNKTRQVYVAQDDQQLFIHLDGKNWLLECIDEFSDAESGSATTSGTVKAPMPGVVVELNTTVGQSVTEGDSLLLIESMKLQMDIRATLTGVVQSIYINGAGDTFDKGSVLIEIAEDVPA